MNENEILGFDPKQLAVFDKNENQNKSSNPLIYHTRPADSKSEDGVYRATIKIIYNPFDLRHSVLEQQSYFIQDENGYLTVVSSLTNNDTSCPIFKAWKKCHYAEERSPLWLQAAPKDKGGKGLFDKRFNRYVTIQVMEDKNQPDLVGQYLFWKLPKSIWDVINAKMNPSPDSGKPSIPVMDFLFGRAIDIEVIPGPDDKSQPERRQRETKYMGEISEDVVSCTNPDGSPLLSASEQEVLDEYIAGLKTVLKIKDPQERATASKALSEAENTKKLQVIYKKVIENIKQFCPNLIETMGYKEWSDETKERVQKWIDAVLQCKDPKEGAVPSVADAGGTQVLDNITASFAGNTQSPAQTSEVSFTSDSNDDLPF